MAKLTAVTCHRTPSCETGEKRRHSELSSLCLCFFYKLLYSEQLETEADTNTNRTRTLIARRLPIKATERIPASIGSRAGRALILRLAPLARPAICGPICPFRILFRTFVSVWVLALYVGSMSLAAMALLTLYLPVVRLVTAFWLKTLSASNRMP